MQVNGTLVLLTFAGAALGCVGDDPSIHRELWGGALGPGSVFGEHHPVESCTAETEPNMVEPRVYSVIELVPEIDCLALGATPCRDSALAPYRVGLVEQAGADRWLDEYEGTKIGLNLSSYAKRSDAPSDDVDDVEAACATGASVDYVAHRPFVAMVAVLDSRVCEVARGLGDDGADLVSECWPVEDLEERPAFYFD